MERIEVKLDKLLKEKNYPKYRLSKVSGIDYRTILKYCKCDIQNIKLDNLLKICQVLDCKVEDILEYRKWNQSFYVRKVRMVFLLYKNGGSLSKPHIVGT